jgi:hypothetical protein
LVDDFPPHIERWLERHSRGFVVMPAQSHNAAFSHPRVLRYAGPAGNKDEYRRLLQRLEDARGETDGELIAQCDVDNTLADYDGQMRRYLKSLAAPFEVKSL